MTRLAKPVLLLAAATALFVAAVAPPLDRLADRSFAWHMLQHLVMLFPVPLLVLLARPFDLFVQVAGKGAAAGLVRATQPLHALASPPVVLTVFLATLWATHFSALYELSLEWPALHVFEHLLYVAAGIAFWLPVVAPPPLRPLAYPARLLYLAVALPQGALLGMVIGSSPKPLYAHYVAAAGSVSSALADQADAAAVMWIAGGFVVFSAFLLTLASWACREAERVGRNEAGGEA
ncbi:MAG: cytochrome c oxidase assembly protein [Candidatus Eremiobacteraeota bacterium]|nr:cytochrome c oxidase assembly protein [Candidatus Eremiobacteraeota bacterium]MBV8374762.1 cytochrome c oxidase assembly protein [Candidatus Eremiobacteraeota bacterium]